MEASPVCIQGRLTQLRMTAGTQLKSSYRFSKRVLRTLAGKDLMMPVQLECERLILGHEKAQWCVCPTLLSSPSVVYSVGVGEDISFDLGLISRFGVTVHAFDPTPRSIAWSRAQSLPEAFVLHPIGLAGYDGTARFHPPKDARFVSYSQIDSGSRGEVVEAPVRRLATVMSELHHQSIDLLKMDIDGTEYEVLKDMLSSGVQVRQLLVEFHHRWPGIGVHRTKEAIRKLNEAGYRIFHISPSGEEYSFARVCTG